jgi:aminoglycoside/choline kinase family phosphotransferase
MNSSTQLIIANLYRSAFQEEALHIEKIPQSGSDREYFKVKGSANNCIATYGKNIKENQTFIQFARHFRSVGAPVPEIIAVADDSMVYLQEDVGHISLLQVLEEEGFSERVFDLFQKSLRALAHLQVKGHHHLNYEWCITSKEFGKQAIMADLLYFKYYFLDTLQIPYDKEKLLDDFEVLSIYLARADHRYFMYRDFQSRNILIQDDEVRLIDFQGGMKGAVQYDVASLLWQAKADLTDNWKNKLLDYYISELETVLGEKVDHSRFIAQYNGYVLIRLLQVLGAYGFRGLFERKAHFLTSIPLALRNLKSFLSGHQVGLSVPEFERLLSIITGNEIIQRFSPARATEETPLIVEINSFSYKTNGIPKDDSEHGGGFVFDCRSIFNPGRFEDYKTLTGRDKEVKDFLEQKSKMPQFLNSVFSIVDIAVEDYMQRKFQRLQISFGCTGGQHRSVYAADALARHLKNKYGVKIQLQHLVQDAKNWINTVQ